MTTLISLDQFRKSIKAGKPATGPVYRLMTDDAVEVEDTDRTLRFCFSDASVDRMGDTISVDGWDLTDFNRNPVALWAHDSYMPPVGTASRVGPEGQRLMGDITFADAETYSFADTIYRLLKGKFLRAVSVGFMPIEYSYVESSDRPWGIDFKKQTLLEISVCPIPANPNALGEARAKGIDTRPLVEWAEKVLDDGAKTVVSKSDLERLRRLAKEPPMRTRTPKPRATGASEDDPASGGALVGCCARADDQECGMKDPAECSIHGKTASTGDDDDAEKMLKLLRKLGLLKPRFRADDGSNPEDDTDIPLEHQDSIRMAHRCLRASKSFHKEADGLHQKAMDLIGGVMDAMDEEPAADGDDDGDGGQPAADDPDAKTLAAKAAERRARLRAVAG